MNKFNVGDVVRLKDHEDNHGKGLVGEIACFKYGLAGIRFREREDWMHNLHNALPDKHGWFVQPSKLELDFILKPYDPTQGNEEDDV